MTKVTRENALDNKLRRIIYTTLLESELNTYDLTALIFKKVLAKKKRKWIKKYYDKVKYHIKVLKKLGMLRVTKEEREMIVEPLEDGNGGKPIEVVKVYYRSVR